MEAFATHLEGVIIETWRVLWMSAPYVLFGFLIAALIRALLPEDFVAKQLGGRKVSSVFKAAVFGVPLPLCSCGVVPAAMGLRKQGASRGATSAFLVSTPETGVDSIAMTYAMLDPLMTVLRPITALFTAMVAGVAENFIGRAPAQKEGEAAPGEHANCCGGNHAPAREEPPVKARVVGSIRYVYTQLLDEIGPWLLVGALAAGAIGYLMPAGLITRYLEPGLAQMMVMLVAGIPLYVCATASTPIAAMLVAKGISPGAAMVFLLAGPATNASTMTVIGRFLGGRSLTVYLASIALCSLAAGYAVDGVYTALGMELVPNVIAGDVEHAGVFQLACAAVLLVLIVRAVYLRRVRPRWRATDTGGSCCHAEPAEHNQAR